VQYLIMVCSDDSISAVPDLRASTEAWVAEMEQRGIRLTGNRLRPVADSTTVRVRDGEVLVTDGPFAEGAEHIGGFDVLECADLDEAIEVASKHPFAAFGGLEVRPVWT
jgi:hypothetical protein